MPPLNENVLERIKKLLVLSKDSGASEAEAQLAAERVQSLLIKYDLSLDDVSTDTPAEDVVEEQYDEGSAVGNRRWELYVAYEVAQLYMCNTLNRYYRTADGKHRIKYVLIGRQSRVIVAKLMIEYLFDAVDRLVKEMRDAKWKETGGGDRAYTQSFRLGCGTRIAQRLKERRLATAAGLAKDEQGSRLPALRDQYLAAQDEIQRYIDAKVGKVTTIKRGSQASNPAGYAAGKAAGDRVGLNPQVGGASSSKKLIG